MGPALRLAMQHYGHGSLLYGLFPKWEIRDQVDSQILLNRFVKCINLVVPVGVAHWRCLEAKSIHLPHLPLFERTRLLMAEAGIQNNRLPSRSFCDWSQTQGGLR